MTILIIFFLHITTIFIIYYYAYHHIVLFHLVYMLTGEILSQKHTERKKIFISEYGVFPSVIVWVQHGQPGNLHPYNFNA